MTAAIPSCSGSGFHASAPTAAARGWVRAARRRAGVELSSASPMRSGVASSTRAEVVAGARANVHDRARASRAFGRLGQRGAQPREMAGGEERVPCFDHLGAVARAGHEIHVALARDVERVALLAAQDTLTLLERAGADRAAEQIDGLAEHRGIGSTLCPR